MAYEQFISFLVPQQCKAPEAHDLLRERGCIHPVWEKISAATEEPPFLTSDAGPSNPACAQSSKTQPTAALCTRGVRMVGSWISGPTGPILALKPWPFEDHLSFLIGPQRLLLFCPPRAGRPSVALKSFWSRHPRARLSFNTALKTVHLSCSTWWVLMVCYDGSWGFLIIT